MGSPSLLQGIFPTQGSTPVLLHCRQILYQEEDNQQVKDEDVLTSKELQSHRQSYWD